MEVGKNEPGTSERSPVRVPVSPETVRYDNNALSQLRTEASAREVAWTLLEDGKMINNLLKYVPARDRFTYKGRLQHIPWDKVAFAKRSGEECKKRWNLISRQLRRHITMWMMLMGASQFIYSLLWRSNYKAQLPKKPIGPFFRFLQSKRSSVAARHPELTSSDIMKVIAEMYHGLSERKKRRYVEATNSEMAQYTEKINQIREEHPEQCAPKPPPLARTLYAKKKVEKKMQEDPTCDEKSLHKQYVSQWATLSENRKASYKEKYSELRRQYESDLADFTAKYPDHANEIQSNSSTKKGDTGTTKKPPSTAYSLFCSNELKQGVSMHEIAAKWRELGSDEKNEYKEEVSKLKTLYEKETGTAYRTAGPQNTSSFKPRTPKKSANRLSVTPKSAFMLYYLENRDKYSHEHSDLTETDVFVRLQTKFSSLSPHKRAKYVTSEEESVKDAIGVYESRVNMDVAPIKPPKTGCSLFNSQIIPELKGNDTSNNFREANARWKILDPETRRFYQEQAKALNSHYEQRYHQYIIAQAIKTGNYVEAAVQSPSVATVTSSTNGVVIKTYQSSTDDTVTEDEISMPLKKKPQPQGRIRSANRLSVTPKPAFMLYYLEKRDKYTREHNELTGTEVFTELQTKFSGMPLPQKAKYLYLEEESVKAAASLYENGENVDAVNGPIKPPRTGCSLFTSQIIPELKGSDSSNNFVEANARWKILDPLTQLFYRDQAKALNDSFKLHCQQHNTAQEECNNEEATETPSVTHADGSPISSPKKSSKRACSTEDGSLSTSPKKKPRH